MADHLVASKGMLLNMKVSIRYDVCFDNVSAMIKKWQDLRLESYLSELNSQINRRKVVGLFIVLAFLLTYTITFMRSIVALRSKKHGREPPMAPYWIPFLGNLLPFIWDPFKYCAEATWVPTCSLLTGTEWLI